MAITTGIHQQLKQSLLKQDYYPDLHQNLLLLPLTLYPLHPNTRTYLNSSIGTRPLHSFPLQSKASTFFFLGQVLSRRHSELYLLLLA